MRRINGSVVTGAVLIICLLLALPATHVWAGGPVCRTPQCMPPMCAPPMMFCGPTVCAPPMPCPPPVCAPPMCCPPPVCAPPMPCPPPICKVPRPCPPPVCKAPGCGPEPCRENPLAKMFRGACDIVTGAIALPFAALDCILENGLVDLEAGLARLRLSHVVLLRPVCRRCAVPVLHMAWVRADDRWELVAIRLAKWSHSQSASLREIQLFAGPALGIFGNYW